jgi:SAM-dependent methyltransferase
MPDLQWNTSLWDGSYDWRSEGEEWSSWWGGSEAQWFGALYPRIHRFLPAKRILEIAPGFGRWTRYLLPVSEAYVGIDLSGKAVAACQKSFGQAPHARFVQNDGFSLDDAADAGFDFIFSFDSLVHAEMDVMGRYIPQLVKKLSGSGVAFIHHSNFLEIPEGTANPHSRAVSVSGRKVAEVIDGCGGKVLVQEIINWGGADLIDCLTVFGREDAFGRWSPIEISNSRWVDEMNIIREIQSPYCTLPNVVGGGGAMSSLRRLTFGPLSGRFRRAMKRLRKGASAG